MAAVLLLVLGQAGEPRPVLAAQKEQATRNAPDAKKAVPSSKKAAAPSKKRSTAKPAVSKKAASVKNLAAKGKRTSTAKAASAAARVATVAALAAPATPLAQALLSADKGDWQWARRVGDNVGSPLLRSYFRWRELLESDNQLPFAAYDEFLRQGGDWPSLGTIQTRAEASIDESVAYEQRLAFFERRPPRTRQGRVRYAEALLAVDRRAEAIGLLRQSWIEDNYSGSEEDYFLERYGHILTAADHAVRLDRLLWDDRIDEARRMLGRVGAKERLLALARLKLQLSDATVEAAVDAVPPELQRDPGLLFDRLRWRRQKANDVGAAEILLNQPADLRRPEKWWDEHEKVIRELIDDRDFELAYRIAAAHQQQKGAELAEAEWLSGWLALRFLNQPAQARRHFERMWPVVTTPISRGRAAYWAGRAAAQSGDRKAAQAWYAHAASYPTSFYGQLAALEIGVDIADRLGPSSPAPSAARNALKRRVPAQLASFFCAQGQPRYAQPFFRHLGYEAADASELRAVIELAQACDRADLVLAAARAAASNGKHLTREAYPVPSVRTLREAMSDLPEPALRLAVARQESLFDPSAASRAGALGLMQLMPATAEAVARDLGLPYSRTRLTRDPEYNARLGSRYLQRQLARYDDEPALALAAYNAGPGRVARWLDAHGDPRLDRDPYRMIDWIELIPFSETRNYVQRVLEGRGMYRALLAGSGTSAGAATADNRSVRSEEPAS